MFVLVRVTFVITAMVMGLDMKLSRHGIKLSMPDTGLRQYLVCKRTNFGKASAQGHAFKTGIMINVEVNRGDGQIVVFVLGAH